MKTLGFQTFLSNPEAEPRGIQLIKSKYCQKYCIFHKENYYSFCDYYCFFDYKRSSRILNTKV